MAASVDHKVSGGHVSRAEERQVLADLTGFPNLAAMLAFEETWKKKKQKKNKKKKQKIECEIQNDTDQHHLKPGQMAVIEGPKFQEVVILSDNDDDEVTRKIQSCKMDGKDTMQSIEVKIKRESREEEVERGNNVGVGIADDKMSNGYISKVDEYQMLTDLTDFPNLAAMLAFEATWKKNIKKNKNKKRRIKIRAQNDTEQHHQKSEQIAAAEEPKLQDNGGMNNGQSCEINGKDTTEVREGTKKQKISKNEEEKGDNIGCKYALHEVGYGHISKADEYKMLTDLTGFPNLAAMLAFEAAWRKNRKKKNKKKNRKLEFQVPNNMVHAMEEDNWADSSKERKPFQTKPVKRMDDIVQRKLLVTDCFICYGRGHLANDCPEKHVVKDESSKICLRCGDSGHDLFSCSSDYSFDDLKEIQCFICKAFGHLCCVDYLIEAPRQVSCYKCGQADHLGSECTKLLDGASDL